MNTFGAWLVAVKEKHAVPASLVGDAVDAWEAGLSPEAFASSIPVYNTPCLRREKRATTPIHFSITSRPFFRGEMK